VPGRHSKSLLQVLMQYVDVVGAAVVAIAGAWLLADEVLDAVLIVVLVMVGYGMVRHLLARVGGSRMR
jgi:hypothetical protein